jgi:hypothetical protein
MDATLALLVPFVSLNRVFSLAIWPFDRAASLTLKHELDGRSCVLLAAPGRVTSRRERG